MVGCLDSYKTSYTLLFTSEKNQLNFTHQGKLMAWVIAVGKSGTSL